MPAVHRRTLAVFAAALLASALLVGPPVAGAATETPPVPPSPYTSVAAAVKAGFLKQETVDLAAEKGTAPVVVQLILPAPFKPEGTLGEGKALDTQRAAIKTAQDTVVNKLASSKPLEVKRYRSIPHLAMELTPAGLDALVNLPNLAKVSPDRERAASLSQSVPFIGGNKVRNANNGSLGSGQSVAILDTGVDTSHSFLSGRVISEACFSTDSWWHSTDSFCPNGGDSQSGAGTAAPCPISGCDHGTHVAGIAAGKDSTMTGVAPEANIIAMKVFLQENDDDDCQDAGAGNAPCPLARDSDVLGALDFALQIGPAQNLAAVNLSLGGGAYTNQSDCDSDNSDFKDAIDNLRSVGIATVAAAGNTGMVGLAAPACISSAISVGAIDNVTLTPERVVAFSQTANFLNLLAPGTNILSSVPGNGFAFMDGTSMATPHVTGAWAALRSIAGNQSVQTILNSLTSTGTLVNDVRTNVRKPRINLVGAAEQLTNAPLAPSNLRLTSRTGTSATFSWTDNAQSETSFALEFQRVTPASSLWVVGVSPAANAASGTITGLTPNTAYNFRVLACSAISCSNSSNVVTASTLNTLPSVPNNLRASNITNHSFDLSWDETSTNPFTSFDVAGVNATQTVTGSTRMLSFTGLAADTSYYPQVRACNADGCSAYSSYLSVRTLTIVPIPATPTNLHVCGTQPLEFCLAGYLTLLWNDNASNETSYELQSTVAIIGQNPFTGPWNSLTLGANATAAWLNNPSSGTLNYYKVRACNAGGCSTWSNTLMYTAP